jgi:hypothetical protein
MYLTNHEARASHCAVGHLHSTHFAISCLWKEIEGTPLGTNTLLSLRAQTCDCSET